MSAVPASQPERAVVASPAAPAGTSGPGAAASLAPTNGTAPPGAAAAAFGRPTAGFSAVAQIAGLDLVDLVVVAVLTIGSIAVGAWLIASHSSTVRETARLNAVIKREGDYETRLAEVERRIEAARVEREALAARVTAQVQRDALESRLKFKADEIGLETVSLSGWEERNVAETLGPGGTLELRRYDRTIDVRGGFAPTLSFLATIESWDELVAIRAFTVRRAPRAGEVLARIEISAYQSMKNDKEKSP